MELGVGSDERLCGLGGVDVRKALGEAREVIICQAGRRKPGCLRLEDAPYLVKFEQR